MDSTDDSGSETMEYVKVGLECLSEFATGVSEELSGVLVDYQEVTHSLEAIL